MISFPPCKINLGLHVVRKRADGYHDLSTCFYPVPWTDVLEIIPASDFSFSSSGNPIPGEAAQNLCIKAYSLLQAEFNLPAVKIHLHKTIPTGAGLGGGSSDGAHTLRLLNQLFNLGLSSHQLQHYASQLGSDCSFFINDVPQLGSGRGEILQPIAVALKNKFAIIVKPEIHVSTAEAYAGVAPQSAAFPLEQVLSLPLGEWKEKLSNDFEKTVFAKYPLIEQIKEKLYHEGALYASMSGSGSAVFGIFSKPVDLKRQFSGCVYWSGMLEV
jgi:4-diphosphocytidyl-2-C-methyl-D-erythritol kinase